VDEPRQTAVLTWPVWPVSSWWAAQRVYAQSGVGGSETLRRRRPQKRSGGARAAAGDSVEGRHPILRAAFGRQNTLEMEHAGLLQPNVVRLSMAERHSGDLFVGVQPEAFRRVSQRWGDQPSFQPAMRPPPASAHIRKPKERGSPAKWT